jgi:predicted nuclease with TOPRIM domain
METKQDTSVMQRDGNTLYILHERAYYKGKPVICNKFSMGVNPDYGDGMTDRDAETFAEEIQTMYNNHASLQSELSDYKTKYNEQCKRIDDLNTVIADKEERIKELEDENNELTLSLQVANQGLDCLYSENEELKGQAKDLGNQL